MPADEHELDAELRPKDRNYGQISDGLPFINSVLIPV